MKKILFLILFFTLPSLAPACTTFFISDADTKIFGRNYDFQIGKGLLIVNKKNISKQSPTDKNNNSIKWISTYGSVTFNQFGKEYPMGGMNEAGLVVELMWLDGTEYPEADSRPAVNTLLWIQYQLDNASTVQDIIDSDSIIRISRSSVPIHYLVADKNGNCAAIEFIGGKMVYHLSNDMPYRVLTNDFYSASVDYVSQYKEFGGNKELENNPSSLNRFARTCKLVKEYDPIGKIPAVNYSFDILSKISQGQTQWSIVYDLNNLKVLFRTKEADKIKSLSFQNLDFACSTPAKTFDVNSDNVGNISQILSDYSHESNYDLIKYAFTTVDFLKGTSEETIKSLSAFPDSFRCDDK